MSRQSFRVKCPAPFSGIPFAALSRILRPSSTSQPEGAYCVIRRELVLHYAAMILRAQYVLPITAPLIRDGAIRVVGQTITDVGPAADLVARYPHEAVSDFGKAALLPGFIDAHTNLEHSVIRASELDVPFAQWTKTMIRNSAKLNAADWYSSAVLGGLEALSFGITCVANTSATGAAVGVMRDLGLRGIVYREVVASQRGEVDAAMERAENDVLSWMCEVDNERVQVGVMPGSLYSCHPAILTKVAELATRENLQLALHVAGSKEEFNFIRYGSSAFKIHDGENPIETRTALPWMPSGTSPVRYAVNWGAFDAPNVVAVHCVHINDEDVRFLKTYDVAVCVCSRTNAQLGMGVAPILGLRRAGLRIGFGSDSLAATDSIDMFTQMRTGMLIQRAVDADAGAFLNSTQALEMATIGAARALRLDAQVGSLEAGKVADVIAVDVSRLHLGADADPVPGLVNTCAGTDVLMTMVGGKRIYEKDNWNVDIPLARNLSRVYEARRKLRENA